MYNKKSGLASELIVRNNKDNIDVALLKNGRLVELHKILPENSFSIGDIYLGQIKKTSPQLNAAFVNVGYEKDGFLHYHDLGPQYNSLAHFVKQTMSAKTSKWALSNIKTFPNFSVLANANEEKVLKLWQGLGFYSRARNLHVAAKQIDKAGFFPTKYDDIISLKGVGEYTAAAIASFAYK